MDIFNGMIKKWPKPLVHRSEVGDFSRTDEFPQGLIKPGYLKNLDARGEGPSERIKIHGKIYYNPEVLADYLRSRVEIFVTAEKAADILNDEHTPLGEE